MKKHLLFLILLSFLIPSVTFAIWWNPLSWFNGWGIKKEKIEEVKIEEGLTEKTEQEEKEKINTGKDEIEKLKKEIENLKKQTVATTNSEKSSKKVTVDLCSNIPGDQLQVPGGYALNQGACYEIQDVCPNISGVQEKIPEGKYFYGNTKECLTQNEIESIEELISEQNRETKKIELNNQLVSEYNLKIRNIDKEILSLQKKYSEEKKKLEENFAGSQSALNASISDLAKKFDEQIQDLEFEKSDLYYEYQEKIENLGL